MKAYESERGSTYPDYQRGIYYELARINENLNELIELLRLSDNSRKDKVA